MYRAFEMVSLSDLLQRLDENNAWSGVAETGDAVRTEAMRELQYRLRSMRHGNGEKLCMCCATELVRDLLPTIQALATHPPPRHLPSRK